ncbi:MAG TPA: hypothetical protein VGQ69_06120 [Gemmatimonadales bacterium]|nr:hypothetical protein [Gemmatimonadales bacterium]
MATLVLAIAGLSFWMCYDIIVHPPETPVDRITLWLTIYAIGFVAAVATLFGLRIAVPRMRLAGNRVIGFQGMLAFGLIYGLMLILGLLSGNPKARVTVAALAFGAALGVALKNTFRR